MAVDGGCALEFAGVVAVEEREAVVDLVVARVVVADEVFLEARWVGDGEST